MKIQTTNNFTTSAPGELKTFRKPLPVAKKPTYIYTEADLGIGLLDIV